MSKLTLTKVSDTILLVQFKGLADRGEKSCVERQGWDGGQGSEVGSQDTFQNFVTKRIRLRPLGMCQEFKNKESKEGYRCAVM